LKAAAVDLAPSFQNMLSKYRSGIDASVKGMSNVARREALPKQVKSFLIAWRQRFS
jgi:hypothetical protein